MAVEFEWDEEKSRKTKQTRGVDFNDACRLWNDSEAIEVQVRSDTEVRWAKIGKIFGAVYTAIFTFRGKKVRIISIRRARPSEAAFYGQR